MTYFPGSTFPPTEPNPLVITGPGGSTTFINGGTLAFGNGGISLSGTQIEFTAPAGPIVQDTHGNSVANAGTITMEAGTVTGVGGSAEFFPLVNYGTINNAVQVVPPATTTGVNGTLLAGVTITLPPSANARGFLAMMDVEVTTQSGAGVRGQVLIDGTAVNAGYILQPPLNSPSGGAGFVNVSIPGDGLTHTMTGLITNNITISQTISNISLGMVRTN